MINCGVVMSRFPFVSSPKADDTMQHRHLRGKGFLHRKQGRELDEVGVAKQRFRAESKVAGWEGRLQVVVRREQCRNASSGGSNKTDLLFSKFESHAAVGHPQRVDPGSSLWPKRLESDCGQEIRQKLSGTNSKQHSSRSGVGARCGVEGRRAVVQIVTCQNADGQLLQELQELRPHDQKRPSSIGRDL